MTANTLRHDSAILKGRLCGLEKNLARLRVFQEKGCPIGRSLHEITSELAGMSEQLVQAKDEKNDKTDGELGTMITQHRRLLVQCSELADGIEPQGMILASAGVLPAFFVRTVARCPGLWLRYEYVATFMGICLIAFTCGMLTYCAAIGRIPFIQAQAGGSVGVYGLAFVLGIGMGLSLHEFSHGIVLANNGIKIKRVGAVAGGIVGGFVEADEESFLKAAPETHMRFNACGIGGNALTAVLLSTGALLCDSGILLSLALGNLFFGMINSLPVSPLDGGWVYEDLIHMHINSEQIRRILLSAKFFMLIIWLALFTHSILVYRT
jgi:Zn-dependent protease